MFQDTKTKEMPDIVVLGLQEVIKSTVVAMIGQIFTQDADTKYEQWTEMVTRALNYVNQTR